LFRSTRNHNQQQEQHMSENTSLWERVHAVLQTLPEGWTELERVATDSGSYAEVIIYLDHPDYGAQVHLIRDTDPKFSRDNARARCFRKDGQLPTHEEPATILAPVFGANCGFKPRYLGGDKRYPYCRVGQHRVDPQRWQIWGLTMANPADELNARYGLELVINPAPPPDDGLRGQTAGT